MKAVLQSTVISSAFKASWVKILLFISINKCLAQQRPF